MFVPYVPRFHHKNDSRVIGPVSHDLNRVSAEKKLDDPIEQITPVNELFNEFCSNSTIHGVRYFTQRHLFERLFWLIAFSLSVGSFAYSVMNIWTKWTENPVIVSFDDKTTPIGMIPFPAVTICPTQKFIKEKVNYDKFMKALTAGGNLPVADYSVEELYQLDAIFQTCFRHPSFDANTTVPSSSNIYRTIEKITLDQELTISEVYFRSLPERFNIFKPIFTGEGLCYTFNSLDSSKDIYADDVTPELKTVRAPNKSDWSLENGYRLTKAHISNRMYPLRVFGSSLRDSLIVSLGLSMDISHRSCNEFAPGFRIALHVPDELAQLPNNFIQIPPDQDVYIAVKPEVIKTSSGLRPYSPPKRGCFFKSERQLRFFKSYSQKKCELECLTNFTLKQCKCVHFSMPRENNTRVCSMTDIGCYYIVEFYFGIFLVVDECNCLPDCTSISYNVEISQAYFKYIEEIKSQEMCRQNSSTDECPDIATSNLFIETSTMTEFISSCGGLMGLFMGISVLSIIELFYYFTLRLCCTLREQEKLEAIKHRWDENEHQQNDIR